MRSSYRPQPRDRRPPAMMTAAEVAALFNLDGVLLARIGTPDAILPAGDGRPAAIALYRARRVRLWFVEHMDDIRAYRRQAQREGVPA